MSTDKIQRLLDANLNRAREGLRVVEDYVRFVLNDKALSAELKQMRHDLGTCAKALPCGLRSRNTTGDVGTTNSTTAEGKRQSPADVARASIKRLQEALRVLEEYSKIDHPRIAKKLEKIRYASYTLEQRCFEGAKHLKLQQATLYGLITKSLCNLSPEDTAKAMIDGGVDVIQLREKEMTDKAFLKLATKVKAITDRSDVVLLINDRIPLAMTLGADGVHLGQDDLPIKHARAIMGPNAILGLSTHSVSQANGAAKQGADYIGIGPVWETNTKKHRHAIGLEIAGKVAKTLSIPYFAIGSVNRNSISSVLCAGVKRVAICTGISLAQDVRKETQYFKRKLR